MLIICKECNHAREMQIKELGTVLDRVRCNKLNMEVSTFSTCPHFQRKQNTDQQKQEMFLKELDTALEIFYQNNPTYAQNKPNHGLQEGKFYYHFSLSKRLSAEEISDKYYMGNKAGQPGIIRVHFSGIPTTFDCFLQTDAPIYDTTPIAIPIEILDLYAIIRTLERTYQLT